MKFIEHPVFVGWIALVAQLPVQLFFTLWAGLFFGGLAKSLARSADSAPFVMFGAIAFFGIPIVAYFGKKLNYGKTNYTFYEDRLEFEEGFFSRNKKVIKYRDVLEVSLRRGILQRSCGLGTIYLATLATGSSGPRTNPFYALGFGNISASGVGVRDIHDPDTVFDRIRALIDSHRG
jgi:membrane protein YdbS with pleckstrin-like domain